MKPGQRLRKLRQNRKMTQAQLARELGVTEFTVCRYENGRIAMPAAMIKRAAMVFGACPAYLLGETSCTLGTDLELIETLRRAERLGDAQRNVIKHTLLALLDSLTESLPDKPPDGDDQP